MGGNMNFQIMQALTVVSLLFLTHWLMRDTNVKEVASKASPTLLGIGWAVMIFLILIAQGTGEQFIYFQF